MMYKEGPHERGGPFAMTDRFYLSSRWKALRKRVLLAAKYTDELRPLTEANTVHHIFPRETYPEYEWERWNLIAVNDKTHRLLHTPQGELSNAGRELMESTAAKQGIPISKAILIIGEPGTGKTTCAKKELRGGLCYDLDHIAAALRLTTPHAEHHAASRSMAQRISKGFVQTARGYTGRVLIIRTAPSLEEIADIDPDEIIVCEKNFIQRGDRAEREEIKKRILDAEDFAKKNSIGLRYYPPRGADV